MWCVSGIVEVRRNIRSRHLAILLIEYHITSQTICRKFLENLSILHFFVRLYLLAKLPMPFKFIFKISCYCRMLVLDGSGKRSEIGAKYLSDVDFVSECNIIVNVLIICL